MDRAWSAWRRGDLDEASDITRRWVPGESSSLDVRDSDWHILDTLVHFTPETHCLEKATFGNIYCAQFAPDGSILALGGSTGRIGLWDVRGRRPLAMLEGHRNDVNSLAFSADGSMLASSADDGTVRLWDVAEKKSVRIMTGPGPSRF